ncbi:MAG: hypothetical protein M3Y27_31250, partial [Acidobacteriota bacterium]|nr:hypothetical protein [Acidobacteriota bacterium]
LARCVYRPWLPPLKKPVIKHGNTDGPPSPRLIFVERFSIIRFRLMKPYNRLFSPLKTNGCLPPKLLLVQALQLQCNVGAEP